MKHIHDKKNLSQPYRIYDILKNKWGLVSPHRVNRPWSGQIEKPAEEEIPGYDRNCYLCPGNKRVENKVNPKYTSTFVFVNDHPALLPNTYESLLGSSEDNELFKRKNETGICEVVCYSPNHNKTMMNMSTQEIERVINVWQERFKVIGLRKDISHVLIFENRGKEMGASNPHPHGQIWAQEHTPHLAAIEINQQKNILPKKIKICF
jgi:UDPglucose--hexose-1-phosphate uridylyltransferase